MTAREDIRSADGRLAAILAGREEAEPKAPLLVCIHGGGCCARYFDLHGFSTLQRALARQMPVLLVDRPGHGGSAPARSDHPIEEAAELIAALIDDQRAGREVAVIGHSIGGAVAMRVAGQRPNWLRTIAISGIGDEIAPTFGALWSSFAVDNELKLTIDHFFGPPGTFRWNAPAALRAAAEPWRMAEARDVIFGWPGRFAAAAAAIHVPVHFRLAEHEAIWRTGAGVVARMAKAFQASRDVDAAILADGGHLYELHKRGGEFVESQLDFILRWCSQPPTPLARAGPAPENGLEPPPAGADHHPEVFVDR